MAIHFIHGNYRFGRKKNAVRKDFCNACAREGLAEAWQSFDWLHLFFIPLIPLGNHTRWECALCHCDPASRYRTGKPMKVAGLIASLIFLAAMIAAKPNPKEMDGNFLWGVRIFFTFTSLGFLYFIFKRNPAVPTDARRKAVVPLNVTHCIYCHAQLQREPELHCPKCQIRFHCVTSPKSYNIDAILALPPDDAVKMLETELGKITSPLNPVESKFSFALTADTTLGFNGLEYWFENAQLNEVQETYDAFQSIGATQRCEFISKGRNVTSEQKAAFKQLDDELYEFYLKNDEDLAALLYKYAVKYIQDFK